MDFLGQQVIPASREAVWQALNDPLILKACLPGCESVERLSPEEFQVVIKTSIGPLRARFEGSLKITEARPPESCVMHFEGQGGAVGFGKGTSVVNLRETAEGTELSYAAKAQIGGKLAQVGSRLIDSVAKKMADDFFKALRQQLLPPVPEPELSAHVAPALAVQPQVSAQMSAQAAMGPDGGLASSGRSASLPHIVAPTGLTVPAWWLAPAAVLGAVLAISGANLIR
jgi:carbon monoxide dehydrogenase subunit G